MGRYPSLATDSGIAYKYSRAPFASIEDVVDLPVSKGIFCEEAVQSIEFSHIIPALLTAAPGFHAQDTGATALLGQQGRI